MDGVVAYILGKSYVKKSLIGIGALAGAPCQVQSINKVGKTTTVTLKWEDNVGGVHTQAFDIEDGLDGVSVTNATINANGNLILTLSDGNDIDCGKVLPQYDTMPPASSANVNQILQYIGTTSGGYTNGYYYKCINDGGVYKWINIKVQDGEDVFRYNVIPPANSSISGAIIQYIGVTNTDYTNGYYYQCVESPIGSGTYIWVQKNVQPNNGGGGGDGVVDGYYKSADQLFYYDSSFLNPIIGEENTLYVDLNTDSLYRYNGLIFIKVSSSAENIQVETLPNADASQENKIYQYIGATNVNYTNGYFYKCINNGGTYEWHVIATQDSYTKAEIGNLSNLPYVNKNVVENIDLLHGSMVALQGSVADIDKEKLNKLKPIYLIGSGLVLDDSDPTSPNYGKLTATGMSIPIDDYLSGSSVNPVQNQVITRAIENLQASKLSLDDVDDVLDASSLYPVQNKVIALELEQLQGSVLQKIQKKLDAKKDDFVVFDDNGDIADSNISKDIVPLTASASNKLLVASDLSPLSEKQNIRLTTPISMLSGTKLEVETALQGLNDEKQNIQLTVPIDTLGGTKLTVEDTLNEFNTEIKAIDTDLDGKADLTDLAPTFSDALAYNKGQYVTYNGDIYRFRADHSAGAWVGTDATKVDISGELLNKVSYDFNAKTGVHNLYDFTKNVKEGANVAISFTDTGVRVYTTSNAAYAVSNVPISTTGMKVGNNYTLEADVTYVSGQGRLTIRDGVTIQKTTDVITSSGHYSVTFELLSNYTSISLFSTLSTVEAGDITFDNIVIKDAEDTYVGYAEYAESNAELTQNKLSYADNGILGAKNLLPNKAVTTTYRGITYTVNSDKTISLDNGTATGGVSVLEIAPAGTFADYTGKYILSGCPSGGSSAYSLDLRKDNSSITYNGNSVRDYGNGIEFDFSQLVDGSSNPVNPANVRCIIRIAENTSGGNGIFKPMLRLASDPDDTYVPYAMTNKELTDKILLGLQWTQAGS